MFRSFQDIEEYFDKFGITTYMGMTKDKVRPGMLIYKDVARCLRFCDGHRRGPDGIVDKDNDQVRLSDRSNPYGFTINFGADWKGLFDRSFSASWGGYTTVPSDALSPSGSLEYCNMPSFWNPDNMYVYQDIYDGSGNIVKNANREANIQTWLMPVSTQLHLVSGESARQSCFSTD